MPRIVKYLGRVEYESTWRAMQLFTAARNRNTTDELWVVEHPPVYTQGMSGRPENLLHASTIPVVKTDRGGQVTYHGPGQLVIYLLLDFRRMNIGVRELIRRIEQAVISMLADLGILGDGDVQAPGVYVDGEKIASIGLRIKNQSVYHGLSLNVHMDLSPFNAINPCGYANLKVTDLNKLGVTLSLSSAADKLIPHLGRLLKSTKEEI